MDYRCLKKPRYERGNYAIVPIRKEDIFKIKEWRNRQIDILRQSRPLTDADQERYWEAVVAPGFQDPEPRQMLFSYLLEDACIGYGGLTHIDWNAKRGEVSFLLDPVRTLNAPSYKKEFLVFLALLKECLFCDLGFHRMFTETYAVRPAHIAALEECGFRYEGTLKDHAIVQGNYCDSIIHGLINDAKLQK